LGVGVWGLGFGVLGLGFGGLGFGVWGSPVNFVLEILDPFFDPLPHAHIHAPETLHVYSVVSAETVHVSSVVSEIELTSVICTHP